MEVIPPRLPIHFSKQKIKKLKKLKKNTSIKSRSLATRIPGRSFARVHFLFHFFKIYTFKNNFCYDVFESIYRDRL